MSELHIRQEDLIKQFNSYSLFEQDYASCLHLWLEWILKELPRYFHSGKNFALLYAQNLALHVLYMRHFNSSEGGKHIRLNIDEILEKHPKQEVLKKTHESIKEWRDKIFAHRDTSDFTVPTFLESTQSNEDGHDIKKDCFSASRLSVPLYHPDPDFYKNFQKLIKVVLEYTSLQKQEIERRLKQPGP